MAVCNAAFVFVFVFVLGVGSRQYNPPFFVISLNNLSIIWKFDSKSCTNTLKLNNSFVVNLQPFREPQRERKLESSCTHKRDEERLKSVCSEGVGVWYLRLSTVLIMAAGDWGFEAAASRVDPKMGGGGLGLLFDFEMERPPSPSGGPADANGLGGRAANGLGGRGAVDANGLGGRGG